MKVRVLAVLVAVCAGVLLPTRADAHAGAVNYFGRFQTSGMMFGQTTGPAAAGTWILTSTVLWGEHGPATPVVLPPAGYVNGIGGYSGWCRNATGTGRITADNHDFDVTWVWLGYHMHITGSSSSGATITGWLQVRPVNGNCITTPASDFDVDGGLAWT